MPGAHAQLSPSSAERWISCPASVRMAEKVPQTEDSSPYAAEGTACHALAEIRGSHEFGLTSSAKYESDLQGWMDEYQELYDVDEMWEHVDAFIEVIRERLAREPHSRVFFEQRVQTGVPRSWGTSDVIIVSPVHVEAIDLKYGKGIRVRAAGNPQLRLYGVGALENIADILGKTETVYITVFQPRLDHLDTEVMDPADLVAWRDSIIPIANEALGPDGHFGPSEDACRFCPARGQCSAQRDRAVQLDFGQDHELLDDEDFAEALSRMAFIREWLNALEAAALERMYKDGKEVPGYKVVMSGGQRKVTDPEAALEALRSAGYEDGQITATKIRGIGDLEKLLGKPKFKELLEAPGHVKKGDGRPSIATAADDRPAANPNAEAQKEFS